MKGSGGQSYPAWHPGMEPPCPAPRGWSHAAWHPQQTQAGAPGPSSVCGSPAGVLCEGHGGHGRGDRCGGGRHGQASFSGAVRCQSHPLVRGVHCSRKAWSLKWPHPRQGHRVTLGTAHPHSSTPMCVPDKRTGPSRHPHCARRLCCLRRWDGAVGAMAVGQWPEGSRPALISSAEEECTVV